MSVRRRKLKFIQRVTRVPKGYIPLKVLYELTDRGFIQNRMSGLEGEIIVYQGRFYVSEGTKRRMLVLYKDLKTPIVGYLKLSAIAKQHNVTVSYVRGWANNRKIKFKRFISPCGTGGMCCYLSSEQQELFAQYRKKRLVRSSQ